jgi:hypothetical protein
MRPPRHCFDQIGKRGEILSHGIFRFVDRSSRVLGIHPANAIVVVGLNLRFAGRPITVMAPAV